MEGLGASIGCELAHQFRICRLLRLLIRAGVELRSVVRRSSAAQEQFCYLSSPVTDCGSEWSDAHVPRAIDLGPGRKKQLDRAQVTPRAGHVKWGITVRHRRVHGHWPGIWPLGVKWKQVTEVVEKLLNARPVSMLHRWGLTFDMSGGPKGAKRPLERPLDGGVRCHS